MSRINRMAKNVASAWISEAWKAQVARAIEQVFGRGQKVDWQYSSFLTYIEGTSYKFHYFAVVRVGSEYVGGNAYGRIGANAKVIEIARSTSRSQVMSMVMNKEWAKEAKGYQKM